MMPALLSKGIPLSNLIKGMDYIGDLPQGDLPDIELLGIAMDSRKVSDGFVFMACAGHRSHGLDYIEQAVSQGAVVVLAEITAQWLPEKIQQLSKTISCPIIAMTGLTEYASKIAGRFYQHPSRDFPVIGITGTNGKTSCSQFIAQAFSGIRKVAVLGTVGNGFINDLQPTTHTTPDPVSLQSFLFDMREQGAEAVAMEVSSHALKQCRVADIDFDLAVLTNFSRDHLDYHGTMEEYAKAKSLLFKMSSLKAALINADDDLGIKLIRELGNTPLRIVAYGIDSVDKQQVDAWIKASNIVASSSGLSFKLESSWGEAEVALPLYGRFNVLNAMVALGVLLECGVEFDDAINSLKHISTVSGRMESIKPAGSNKTGPTVIVDYAHTPDALEQALSSLKDHVTGKLVCIFGCGGDRDKGKRPQMGAIAERLSDLVVLTNDNPRSESPELIIEETLKGLQHPDSAVVEMDREKAITDTIKNALADDVILVAGKGHEAWQIIGEQRLPFSDQACVRNALEAL